MPPVSPPDPPLTDGVVTLRAMREDDVKAATAALRDPDIVRWTRVPADYKPEDFRLFYAAAAGMAERGEGLSLFVVDEQDRIIGSVGLHELDGDRPDIGYWVAAGARGRGVAPRAVRLLRDWAFETLGLTHLEILVDPANEPSLRAAAKTGFRRTGEYRSSPRCGKQLLVVFAWPEDERGGAG